MTKSHKLTNSEKTELLKETMGWYFDGVKPLVWNPCKEVKHLRQIMALAHKKESFSGLLNTTDAMMPFTDKGREKLVDLCGNALKLW